MRNGENLDEAGPRLAAMLQLQAKACAARTANRPLAETLGFAMNAVTELGPDLLATVQPVAATHAGPPVEGDIPSVLRDSLDGADLHSGPVDLGAVGAELRAALTRVGIRAWWAETVGGSDGAPVAMASLFLRSEREPTAAERAALEWLAAFAASVMSTIPAPPPPASGAPLHQLEAELQRTSEDFRHLLYAASHDLQEPLRTIGSFLGLLKRRHAPHLDPEAQEMIDMAVDGANRMTAMIQALLEFSRAGSDRTPLVPIDLRDPIGAALRGLTHRIQTAGATVTISTPLPIVMGDGSQLVRLFANLVGNAVKYHAAGRPPVVEVSARRDGAYWEIAVKDNGIGVPGAAFDRIFLAFQRLHGAGSFEGTGMGLAICKRIVERHGGRIWVESEPGQGSTFRVTLKAAR